MKEFSEHTIDSFTDTELDEAIARVGAAKFYAIYLRYIALAFEAPSSQTQERSYQRAAGVLPAIHAYVMGRLARYQDDRQRIMLGGKN